MSTDVVIDSVQVLPTIPINPDPVGGYPTRSAYELTYELNNAQYTAQLIPVPLQAPPPAVPESIPFVPPASGGQVVVPSQATSQQQLVTWDVGGTTYYGWVIAPLNQPLDQSWWVTAAVAIAASPPGGPSRAPILSGTGPSGQRSQGLVGLAAYPDGTTVLGWADGETNALTLCVSTDWSLDSWNDPIVLGETSTEGMDLFVDPTTNNLYAAWTGTDGNNTPNVAQFLTLPLSTPLPIEDGKQTYDNQSATGATAVAGSYRFDPESETWHFADLFVAFTGTDNSPGTINAAAVRFPELLTDNQAIFDDPNAPQNSLVAPRTYQLDEDINSPDPSVAQQVVTWVGSDAATSLNLLTINWGDNTASQIIVPPSFPAITAPALVIEGAAYLAWADISNTLTLAYSYSGLTDWASQTQFAGAAPATGTGISLIAQNTPGGPQLLVAFTDITGAPFLSAIPLDPTRW